jgi:hypothetical protein
VLGQPAHLAEQPLAHHLVAGEPEPELVVGQPAGLLEGLHVLAEEHHRAGLARGQGQVVLAEHQVGELADDGADLEADQQTAEAAHHLAHLRRQALAGARTDCLGHAAGARLDQRGEAAQHALGPVGAADGLRDQRPVGARQAADRVDPQLRQAQVVAPGALLARLGGEPRQRQGGRRAERVRAHRRGDRDLPRKLPVDRPRLAREQPGELPEQRDATEEVAAFTWSLAHVPHPTRRSAASLGARSR